MILALALRHAFGSAGRAGLSVCGIAFGVLLISGLWTVPAGVRAFLEDLVSEQRLSVTSRGGVSYGIPPATAHRLRGLPGVTGAMGVAYFGAALADGTPLPFPALAVEAERVAAVYPDYEIPAERLRAFRGHRDAALVGERTLRARHWRIGDRVELASSVWGVRVTVEIAGVLPGQPGIWLRLAQLDEALREEGPGAAPWLSLVWLRVSDPRQVAAVGRAVQRLGRELGVPLATQSEASFFGRLLVRLRALARLFEVVSGLVAGCLAILLGNAVSLGLRGRLRELATLRAVGAPRSRVLLVGVAESLALSSLGAALGVGAAAVLPHLGARVEALRAFAGMAPRVEALAAGAVAGLAVGLAAGMASGAEAALRPLAPALREGSAP